MKPLVFVAYFAVVLIWSTTPLTMVWSTHSVHPTMAVLLRMLIGSILGLAILKGLRIHFPWHRNAVKLYAFSAVGIFGGMSFAYASSAYLPSGIMSLFFGLSPFMSGILATRVLSEQTFSKLKKFSLLLALVGIYLIVADGLALNTMGWQGIALILLAVFFFSYSAVLVKSVVIQISPIATTTGALLLTLPFFLLSWFLQDGTLPIEAWQSKALWSIAYLGIFGSLIGFIAYYYILQHLLASTVSLITLMTPVMALWIGSLLNDEVVSVRLAYAAIIIISALSLFIFGDRYLNRVRKRLVV